MLWNGEALEEFSPSRGIRQGDPISPYLFVLCIEKLFQMISLAMDHRDWRSIKVSREGPLLSHLAFVDDVLLFVEAREDQILLIKQILNLFYRCSGQKISEEKTRIFFSKNVDCHVRNHIGQVSGFQITNDLGKYLGVPILHEKVNKRAFQFILDKVDKRRSNKQRLYPLRGGSHLLNLWFRLCPPMSCNRLISPNIFVKKLISIVGDFFGGMPVGGGTSILLARLRFADLRVGGFGS